MKSDTWRRCVKKFVIPELPGEWNTARSILYRDPADWILCCVALSNSRWSSSFTVDAVVQLLAVPHENLVGPNLHSLGRLSGRGLWDAPASVADAAPVMGEVLDLIRAEALPLFDSLGTIAGYRDNAERLAEEKPIDPHYHEQVFCLRLIQGDTAGALQAAEAAERTARADGRPWALELATRVNQVATTAQRDHAKAVEMLRGHAQGTRKNLGL